MGKPKVNPRRVPCTREDVEKAEHITKIATIEFMLTMFAWIMVDKRGCKKKYLSWWAKQINSLSQSINRGYVKMEDLQQTLMEEYDFDIKQFIK